MEASRSDLVRFLKEARQETVALARSLSPQELKVPVHLEGWTVKDVLSHVVASEAGLTATAVRMAGGRASPIPGFNLHAANQRQVEKRRGQSMDELLAEMEVSRTELLRSLDNISDEQFGAKGFLGSGIPTDVISVLRRVGDHELAHCREILGAIGRP